MKSFSKKAGFTLIELLLVITVSLGISFVSFQSMIKSQENFAATAAGSQLKDVGQAVNNYITNHYDTLSSLTNSTGTSADPGPRTCNTANGTCTITTATLAAEGFLPPSFSGTNVYGSQYNIIIKRTGGSPYWNISGLVTTSSPWYTANNRIRYDLLGMAMQVAGSDSGMTRQSANTLEGYKGTWFADNTTYSNINKLGQLGFIAGYGSNSYSVFLRRDGSLPMTGNLNMGTNSINNAKDINGTGDVNMSGKGNFGSEVTAANGYGDKITLGGDSYGNDYELRLSANKQLSVYSPNSTQYSTVLSVNRNTVIGERLATNGMNPNDLPAGWGGGLRTMDIYAAGTVGMGSGGAVNAYLNSAGNIYSTNTINTSGTMYASNGISTGGSVSASGNVSGNGVYGNYIQSNGDMHAAGSISASGNISGNGVYGNYVQSNGSMYSAGRLTTNEYLQINGIASQGGGCSPNGLQGRAPNGSLLSCVNGVWANSNSLQQNSCYWVGNSHGRDFTAYSCAVGEYVAGFQFVGHQHSESAYIVKCCK